MRSNPESSGDGPGWLRLTAVVGVLLLSGCASGPLSTEDRMMSMRPLYAITAPSNEELEVLKSLVAPGSLGRVQEQNGVMFQRANIEGRPCLLFVCGMSVVNAAMTTQAALDRYPITHVILFGAAGGVNPSREPGDVVVAEKWAYHTEAAYVNPLLGGGWELPPGGGSGMPNFGMIIPEIVAVVRSGNPVPVPMPTFEADRGMVAAAAKVSSDRSSESESVRRADLIPGGTGLSGPAFVANREYRAWLYQTWRAEVVDLESTAAAQVCWANRVPFVAVRSVVGLAGERPLSGSRPSQPPVQAAAQVVTAMLKNLPRLNAGG